MKKQLFTLLILSMGISAAAQKSSFSFQYSMGFGTGNLGSFIGKPSFNGAAVEWRKYLNPNVSLGFELGWNAWHEKLPAETYVSGTASLTGKQYRTQNEFPMMVAADYFLKPEAKFQPFVGLGLGTMYSRRNLDMNLYTTQQEAWHFAMRPEVGVLHKIGPETSAYLALKYYSAFKSGELSETQSYLTVNIGFLFNN